MNRKQILAMAIEAVADRESRYGSPTECFGRIAALWNTYLKMRNGELNGVDVAIMMVLLKIARLVGDPNHGDGWVDIAGYAGCGGELIGSKNK
jgi:hypothetical protein